MPPNSYSTAEVRHNITAVLRPSMEQSTLMPAEPSQNTFHC